MYFWSPNIEWYGVIFWFISLGMSLLKAAHRDQSNNHGRFAIQVFTCFNQVKDLADLAIRGNFHIGCPVFNIPAMAVPR